VTCPVCRNLDAECRFCDDKRAQMVERDARKAEAVEWVRNNLVQRIRGEEEVCLPSDPEEVLLMIMSIIAYARAPREFDRSQDGPPKCERFERLEIG
jgi:hypothetical protein